MSSKGRSESEQQKEELLAGTYLSQALDFLFDSGKADVLYPARVDSRGASRQPLIARMLAASKRVELARTSILFSALSTEAYANQFLAEYVNDAGSRKALDRLPFPDKLLLAPQIASGRPLFSRGQEPMQSIDALYKLRTHLVHPRPRAVKIKRGSLLERPGDVDYNPKAAAQILVAVATVVVTLWDKENEQSTTLTAAGVVENQAMLLEFGDAAWKELPKVPERLMPQSGRKLKRARRIPGGPEIPRTSTGLLDEGNTEGQKKEPDSP